MKKLQGLTVIVAICLSNTLWGMHKNTRVFNKYAYNNANKYSLKNEAEEHEDNEDTQEDVRVDEHAVSDYDPSLQECAKNIHQVVMVYNSPTLEKDLQKCINDAPCKQFDHVKKFSAAFDYTFKQSSRAARSGLYDKEIEQKYTQPLKILGQKMKEHETWSGWAYNNFFYRIDRDTAILAFTGVCAVGGVIVNRIGGDVIGRCLKGFIPGSGSKPSDTKQ